MSIDDEAGKRLHKIIAGLMGIVGLLNDMRETKISSRLIPLVDELNRLLVEAEAKKLH